LTAGPRLGPQIGRPHDRETLQQLVGEVKPIVYARTG
jgi:hypothetical protein